MILGWADDLIRSRERELRDTSEQIRSGRRPMRRARHGVSPERRPRRGR